MCFRHRLLGVQVFAPFRGVMKPPLEVVVITLTTARIAVKKARINSVAASTAQRICTGMKSRHTACYADYRISKKPKGL